MEMVTPLRPTLPPSLAVEGKPAARWPTRWWEATAKEAIAIAILRRESLAETVVESLTSSGSRAVGAGWQTERARWARSGESARSWAGPQSSLGSWAGHLHWEMGYQTAKGRIG